MLVAAALEPGGQPHVQDALGQIRGDHFGAHHQDVGVVVSPGDRGGEHAMATFRTYSGDLVRGYLFTAAAAAEDDAEVVGAVDHLGPDVGAQRRVVRDLVGVADPTIVDLVAALLQPCRQTRLHRNGVVVGCDRD